MVTESPLTIEEMLKIAYRVAVKVTTHENAQEVATDAVMAAQRVFDARDQGEYTRGQNESLVCRVAHLRALDRVRVDNRRQTMERAVRHRGQAMETGVELAVDYGGELWAHVLEAEGEDLIAPLLDTLTERQREYVLRRMDGETRRDTAIALSVLPAAVTLMVARVRVRLSEHGYQLSATGGI
jgi:hypothetical protein